MSAGTLTVALRALAASPRLWPRELLRTVARFGEGSLLLAMAVAAGTGAVIVLETAGYTVQFGARDILGGMAGISIVREFGPLMVALVMTARVGARNAAELGSLSVGGQLDSLRGLGVSPYEVLISPRLWGTVLAMAGLVLCADLAAVLGGALSARLVLGIDLGVFLRSLRELLHARDLGEGLIKAVCFGAAIALLSSRAGLATQGGARAVGRSVARAVVQAVVAVLVLDFAVTALLGGRL